MAAAACERDCGLGGWATGWEHCYLCLQFSSGWWAESRLTSCLDLRTADMREPNEEGLWAGALPEHWLRTQALATFWNGRRALPRTWCPSTVTRQGGGLCPRHGTRTGARTSSPSRLIFAPLSPGSEVADAVVPGMWKTPHTCHSGRPSHAHGGLGTLQSAKSIALNPPSLYPPKFYCHFIPSRVAEPSEFFLFFNKIPFCDIWCIFHEGMRSEMPCVSDQSSPLYKLYVSSQIRVLHTTLNISGDDFGL